MSERPMSELTLQELDRDGALEESLAALHGHTRAGVLGMAALGSAGLLTAFAGQAEAAPKARDRDILNFALALEYLQDEFYTEVERIGPLEGELRRQAQVVGAHERAHVKALRGVIGRRAISRPRFDFRGATEDTGRFRRTAVAFEDLAVAAYKGQAPRIVDKSYLVSALAIHSVEARHAAWIRRLAGVQPTLSAFDEPRSKASTLGVLAATNFRVKTRSRRSPRFTG